MKKLGDGVHLVAGEGNADSVRMVIFDGIKCDYVTECLTGKDGYVIYYVLNERGEPCFDHSKDEPLTDRKDGKVEVWVE